MAWLDKLQIKGIRSFDPNSEACGTLIFQKPLTIIVGPNGTGKTTIVESLKFATTGDLPPGAKSSGQFFVHDPKIAHSDVRASVKLFFRDSAEKEITITRNLKSIVKPNGKIECRTEGGIIARKEEKTNELKSLDSKIADINQEFEKKKERLERELEQKRASMLELDEELRPLKERIRLLTENTAEMQGIHTHIEKLLTTEKMKRERVGALKGSISHPFPGSKADLEREIREFDADMRHSGREVEKVLNSIETLDREVQKLGKERAEVIKKIGSMESEAAFQKSREEQRNKKINSLAAEYEIAGFEARSSFEPVSVRRFEELYKDKMRDMEASAAAEEKKAESEVAGVRKEVDVKRSAIASLEENVRIQLKEAQKNESEIESIKKEAAEIRHTQNKLSELEQRERSIKRSLEDKEGELSEDTIKKDINSIKQDKMRMEEKSRELQSEMKVAQQEMEKRSKLANAKENRDKKLDASTSYINAHKDTLTEFFGSVPTENLKDLVEQRRTDVECGKKRADEECGKFQYEMSGLEQLHRTTTTNLKDKAGELAKAEAQMEKGIGSDDLEVLIKEVDKTLEKLRDEKGTVQGGKYIYTKYMEELLKTHPCCPLCSRGFPTKQEAAQLLKKLQESVRELPKNSERLEKEIGLQEDRRGILVELRPVSKRIRDLTVQIPQLEETCKTQNSQISKLKKQIQEKNEEIEELKREEQKLKYMENDMAFVEKYREEISDLDKEIAWIKDQMTPGSRSVDIVQEDVDSVQANLESLSKRLESKHDRLAKHRSSIEDLRTRLNQTEREQLDIRSKLQAHQHSEARIRDLKSQAHAYRQEASTKEKKITPLKGQLSDLQRDLEDLIKKKEALTRSNGERRNVMQQGLRDLQRQNGEMKKYDDDGKTECLGKAKQRLLEAESDLRDLDERKDREKKRKEELEDVRKGRETRKRELQDSMELKTLEEDLKTLDAEIRTRRSALGDFDPYTAERQRQELIKSTEELNKRYHQDQGAFTRLELELKDVKGQLMKEDYTDTTRKYRLLLIQKVTEEQAHLDLLKYYKAMDRAIMHYHSTKMEEINKNLMRLWHSVYRGYDIDAVRIVSEGDEGASTEARKVYNYRVVMEKRGISMDMRGRCSAGQKILASILIRIALAEVFCLSCGVLTLDEPTTNLDSENMMYLARALGTLLSDRQDQHNFQLVLISHDEEFLRHLWEQCRPEYFYSVAKSREGYSQLKRHKDFDEIRHE